MSDKQKRWVISATILIVGVIVFFWVYSHGSIDINVQNPSNDPIKYTFISQQKGMSKTVQTSSSHIKERLNSGGYEVMVQQGDSTGYLLAKAGHFLKTDSHSASLSSESGVMFIGDNPSGCLVYTGQLYSFNCGQSLYDSIDLHVPATKSTPTYTTKINYGLEPLILGAVNTGKNTVLLARSVDIEDPSGYSLILTNSSLAPIKQVELSLKPVDSGYSISPYGNGFVVYANDYSDVEVYSAFGQKPVKVTFESPHLQGLTALSLSTEGSQISTLYTNGPSSKNPESEIVSYSSGGFSHYTLTQSLSKAIFCGTQKLCALSGGNLEVFSLGGANVTYLYSLSGVKTMDLSGSELLVVNDSGVVVWNPDTSTGHISYSWGDYTYQAIQPAPGGYILTVSDKQGNKRALLVNDSSTTDDIDKKISRLLALPQVSGVSIYKNYIFVTPDIGSLVYDKTTNSYTYDPAVKQSVNSKINAEIKDLGINTDKYTIINTSE